MGNKKVVYIVDPDPAIGEALGLLLGTYGIEVRAFADGADFLGSEIYPRPQGVCVLIECNLGGACGQALVGELRNRGLELPVLLLANAASAEMLDQARKCGVVDVIEKPIINNYLFERLAELVPQVRPETPRESTHLANGLKVRFRRIGPNDAEMQQEFVRGLSAQSRYLRFFSGTRQLPPGFLHQLTHGEFPSQYSIIATICDDGVEQQIGVANFAASDDGESAEFSVVVADEWKGQGIARRLLSALTAAAVLAGYQRLESLVRYENHRMIRLAEDLGFQASATRQDMGVVSVVKQLAPA